ncbi:MAG: sulfite exporter TauE/SafE family protein [Planctomycetes bacterium]|nr:sulfite exporter TauE/SafE family protein [Planctomycetota bacterium]
MIILVLVGIIIGAVGTLAGIGGGIFIVPVLFSIYQFSPQAAIGTSLFVVAFNAFSGTVAYARYKRIYWRLGAIIIVSGIPGVIIGAFASNIFTGTAFKIVFAGVLILAAIYLLFRKNKSSGNVKICTPLELSRKKVIMVVFVGFVTGFIASCLGIGGGIIHVPVLIYLLKIPVHIATATSHFILFSTVLLSIVPHALWGHIDYVPGLLMGGGALIGAQVGAYISSKVRPRVILIILAVALVAVALKMLLFSASIA